MGSCQTSIDVSIQGREEVMRRGAVLSLSYRLGPRLPVAVSDIGTYPPWRIWRTGRWCWARVTQLHLCTWDSQPLHITFTLYAMPCTPALKRPQLVRLPHIISLVLSLHCLAYCMFLDVGNALRMALLLLSQLLCRQPSNYETRSISLAIMNAWNLLYVPQRYISVSFNKSLCKSLCMSLLPHISQVSHACIPAPNPDQTPLDFWFYSLKRHMESTWATRSRSAMETTSWGSKRDLKIFPYFWRCSIYTWRGGGRRTLFVNRIIILMFIINLVTPGQRWSVSKRQADILIILIIITHDTLGCLWHGGTFEYLSSSYKL